jgi:hypothetical protein
MAVTSHRNFCFAIRYIGKPAAHCVNSKMETPLSFAPAISCQVYPSLAPREGGDDPGLDGLISMAHIKSRASSWTLAAVQPRRRNRHPQHRIHKIKLGMQSGLRKRRPLLFYGVTR